MISILNRPRRGKLPAPPTPLTHISTSTRFALESFTHTHSTALAALASALLLASAPPQALAAGKVKIRNPKVKVEKESRATLLARAKTERLADLKAKVEMSKGGAKVALGF